MTDFTTMGCGSQVRTVAPEVARFRWDDSLPEFFCTNTVVKVITDTGFEGVAGVSNYTNYAVRSRALKTPLSRPYISFVLTRVPLARCVLRSLIGTPQSAHGTSSRSCWVRIRS